MKQLDEQKEWDFICSETTHLHRSNIPYLWRELLFAAQVLLTLYGTADENYRKPFLASIYLKTKKKYLKGTE